MGSVLLVGTGGALGAMGRYGLSLLPWRGEFPLLTLLTNLLGAVLIGFMRRLHHLFHLFPGEPDPAGAGEVAAGRELYAPEYGAVPAGGGPGTEAKPAVTL